MKLVIGPSFKAEECILQSFDIETDNLSIYDNLNICKKLLIFLHFA